MEKLSERSLAAIGRMTVAAAELEHVLAGGVEAVFAKPGEPLRVARESVRVASESTRVARESTRVAQESTRMARESMRVASESTGVARESMRVAGESTRVAGESVLFAAGGQREELARLVEAAAAQLAINQAALRAMWRGGRTDAEHFDEIATMLLRCGEELQLLSARA